MIATLKTIRDHPYAFWVLLALPGIPMTAALARGVGAEDLIHPTGEFAARFMIIAMMLTPLRMLFPRVRWLAWLNHRRRYLGVAAFGYALLHTILYVVDMETLEAMAREFWALGIWTGWFAFFIFIPLAVTSHDRAVRLLRRGWQWLHRWVYPAAILTLLHWIFVHNHLGPALVHFAPLALLEAYRLYRIMKPRPVAA
ncbi:MAG: ferric reductase-like transmembrane domain-containing protein [Rhodospirillales bacterium]|nr:ferric reductase-like transmembrane domain-containing protein [Rhodospirillales bacterium]